MRKGGEREGEEREREGEMEVGVWKRGGGGGDKLIVITTKRVRQINIYTDMGRRANRQIYRHGQAGK